MARPRIPQKLERLVRERAQGYCEYCLCRESYATERFSLEHIIPLVAGGRSIESNLALACQGCNGAKYIKIRALDEVTG
ncbi:MAG: HNH endonuclease [Blastocatellia bacterium]